MLRDGDGRGAGRLRRGRLSRDVRDRPRGRIVASRRGPVDEEFMRDEVAAAARGAHVRRRAGRWPRWSCWRWRPPPRRAVPEDHPRRRGGRGDVPGVRHAARAGDRGAAGRARARADPPPGGRLPVARSRSRPRLVAEFGDERAGAPRATRASTWRPTWCPALAVLLGGGAVAAAAMRGPALAPRRPGDRGRPARRRERPASERLQTDLDRYEL